jgi:LysR family nitrogen assimilation transcriptional regulator
VSSISLRQLRYFRAVARARSFSAAARMLNVSQPALGLQVRDLETQLEADLFVRHARGVELTQAGELFLSQVAEILDALQRAQASVSDLKTRMSQEIRLGVTPTIGRILFEDLLKAGTRPGTPLKLLLREGLTSDLLRMMREQEVQASFCYDPPTDGGFHVVNLFQEDLVLVRRADAGPLPDVVSIADLPRFPLALGARNDASRLAIERAAATHSIVLDVREEMAPISLKREMLIRHGLSSIVPYGLFLPEISRAQLSAARIDPPICRSMALVMSRDLPAAIRAEITEIARAAVDGQVMAGELGWRRA